VSEKQRGKRVGHRSFGRRAEIIISALLWKHKTVLSGKALASLTFYTIKE
jgi:hypothetical protein